ncbi:uncharacterized protein LOC134275807 [Saccostrea cucullata]|uniref:uncharacterized protein LOC134275807 n=1 Tax=Saccostrea cuccullata TaxID=36930 RepID=UPI002ED311F0
MNLHTDKIECVFILFNILIVHIISAKMTSPYKLRNFILEPYIGKSQSGIDKNGVAIIKQILLSRSRNKQNNEIADDKTQLIDKKAQGSLLAYRPYVHVIIDGRTDVTDGPLYQTDVALSPDMTLYNAIAEASVRFRVEHPCVQNPFRMNVQRISSNCYSVVNVPGVASDRSYRWIVKIVRRRGRVIYENECLPSGRISMRGGTTVTFKKTS